MRKLIAISLLLLVQIATVVAQDTTYYKGIEKVTRKDDYDRYEYNVVNTTDSTQFVTYVFNRDNKMSSKAGYIKGTKPMANIKHGIYKTWYPNGQLYIDARYNKGILIDKLVIYYQNGKIKRKDIYNDEGKLIKGSCYDEVEKEIKWFVYDTPAEYPGGMLELQKFLGQNIKYPEKAKNSKIQGMVIVQFQIEIDGSPTEFNVVKSLSSELDEEALRVLKLMPKWSSAIQDGLPVKGVMSIPIRFKLDK